MIGSYTARLTVPHLAELVRVSERESAAEATAGALRENRLAGLLVGVLVAVAARGGGTATSAGSGRVEHRRQC
jgi:hypothetical protein